MFEASSDPPTQRHSWLFLDYYNSEVRLPHSYSQHFSWLQRAMNDRPEWWQWWDAGFPGESTVLNGWITFGERPRRAAVSSKVSDHRRWVDVSLRMSTASFAALDRRELAQYSPAFVREVQKRIIKVNASITANTHSVSLHVESETGAMLDEEDVLVDLIDPKCEVIFAVFKVKQAPSSATNGSTAEQVCYRTS